MMTDTTEVEKWIILHGELVREHDGPLVWSADYEALAVKLADAERVARYETDIAQQALDQMKAEKARAEAAEARIAHLENHIEGVAKDTHKIMVAYEAALPAVYRLALTDASGIVRNAGHSLHVEIDYLPTPTAAELMARIQTGEE